MEQNQDTSLFGLSIDQTSRTHLGEAARWARFLSIVGFIFLGLFALLMIFGGAYLSKLFSQQYGDFDNETGGAFQTTMTIGIIAYYLVVFLLVFFAYLFLYRFSTNLKKALASNDQETLNRSFQNLKILYRYWGILTIIGLVFFTIAVLIAIVSGAATMGM